MKYSGIGGQAVMEGIMMRSGDKYSVGVRKPDGDIAVEVFDFIPYSERFALARVPFIRGSFCFCGVYGHRYEDAYVFGDFF